ncbi:MAG: di-heme oxidoredictase family protein [Pseudomonadota bacterium]
MRPAAMACGALASVVFLFAHARQADVAGLTKTETDRLRPGGQYLTVDVDVDPGKTLVRESNSRSDPQGRGLLYRDWSHNPRHQQALGPNFDAASCTGCHAELQMASRDPAPDFNRWILKPIVTADRELHGDQLRTRSIGPSRPEASFEIVESTRRDRFADTHTLTRPSPIVQVGQDTYVPSTLRVAPLLFGWGLLENIDPAFIRHFNDPEDRNRDGISGRLSKLDDGAIGLFGWKATKSDLQEQIVAALINDMGIHSPGCAQPCQPEVSAQELEALVDYVRRLPVPDRRSSYTQRGQDLFGLAGCSSCHVPVAITGKTDEPEFSEQLLWPYSDFMLHDMGDALADAGDGEHHREWRTAPLWGIGLLEQHAPYRGFLHDGRARNLREAILWHGGEAEASAAAFRELSSADQAQLLAYLRAL